MYSQEEFWAWESPEGESMPQRDLEEDVFCLEDMIRVALHKRNLSWLRKEFALYLDAVRRGYA
jgi:hypothetical protein